MEYSEGDYVRITAEGDSEYGRELRVVSATTEEVWVEVEGDIHWRYRFSEVKPA